MAYTPGSRIVYAAKGQWAWSAHLSRDCPYLTRARHGVLPAVVELVGEERLAVGDYGIGRQAMMWFRVPDRTRELSLCGLCRKRHARELADAFSP